MTKKEFINAVAEKIEVNPKDVDKVFDAMVFILKEQLITEDKIRLSHLGIFSTEIKRPRRITNKFSKVDENGNPIVIEIPQRRVIKYKPSKYLRDLIDFN
ncbi:HU family DNA-binding protein [Mycoplasmopsis cricetuli]|uniref:HU family DNA-binding protein n=1 Tax=Mycoplasmopsis cricetuli TaxID=171283 RepID=UPI000470D8EB|nr:HU family DNA-binding protein [Mycoplasmopsis cricetuli]